MKSYNDPLTMVGLVFVIVAFPFMVIWALNTLFALGIAYNFWTWLAMLILSATFGKSYRVKIDK